MKKFNSEIQEDSLNDLIANYTKYWYFFILGILIALFGAYFFLRYASPIYNTTETIIIKDESSGGGSELAAFSELSYFNTQFASDIENDLVLLNSKTLIKKAVEELNLNVQYFYEGAIKTKELYKNRPVSVRFFGVNDTSNTLNIRVSITPLSKTQFKLTTIGIESQKYNYGERVNIQNNEIVVFPEINKNGISEKYFNKRIDVVYSSISSIASSYKSKLQLLHEGRNSDVVILSMESELPSKTEDFLNKLVLMFNEDAMNDRNQVALKTSKFIDSRLEIITKELDSVENGKQAFKSANRLTDIDAEAQLILQNANQYNNRQVEVSAQLEFVKSMVDYFDSSSDEDILPSNISLGEPEIISAVNTYNQLILDRNKLIENSTRKNPVVQNLDSQIRQLRSSIYTSIKSKQSNFERSLKDLNRQENAFNTKLSKVPSQEKGFRSIVRQQNIKEQLYVFLLQQREETSISLAVTASKAKIVDKASTAKSPIFPKKRFIYIISIVLGFLLPFLFIYLFNLFNTKISNRRDILKIHKSVPIIGEIPRLKRGDNELIEINDRSILAESFRILRTNLQYLFFDANTNKNHKKIIVTSTIKGEGKTFVAFNLAITLALTGKKVVLVGADIRNPQLHRYLPKEYKSKNGLTEYIVDKSIEVKDLVVQSEHDSNLSIVMSGEIPPNPAELLMQPRVDQFFNEIGTAFDYVIIDTAPSMLVTDTILLNKYASLTLYVLRANYTDKKLLEFSNDAINEGKLENVALILNSVTLSNFGYGNKYGYTYTATKKTFWQRLFHR